MKQIFQFHSSYGDIGFVRDDWQVQTIKTEPMFWRATPSFAYDYGGLITKHILEKLPTGWERGIIDTRVHMLMPGMYPCIPGWHHDDVPRSLPNKQPNYYNPEYESEHIAVLINGDIAPTEFAIGTAQFSDVMPHESYYQVWNKVVDTHIQQGNLYSKFIPSGRLITFNWETWHRGTPARERGWRMFFRITRNTNVPPQNELREQVQVYLNPNDIHIGW